MPHVTFAIPGDIDLATGGYAYDRRVLALLPAAGVAAAHLQLPGGFPAPTVRDLADAEASLVRAGAADGAILMIDGLAYGALPADLIGRITAPIVALVHHPLCLEAGSSPARQDELRRLEIAALRMAARVICTSPTTARTLIADFDVPADKITVAEPGADPAARARGTASVDRAQPVQLLAVGSLIPRKGYDLLVEALFPLKSLAWRLAIAGSADLDAGTARDLRQQIEHRGLSDRISLLGAVDAARLAELYDRADLFVMSSHYEGYGMVLTEALARGLPIVCTTGGAAAETLPDDAALKCQPGEPRALMWVLGRAIEDRGIRDRVGDQAWIAAQQLQRWPDTAGRIAAVIKDMSA